MESGNQCVLYEKLIKLSQNFNKHLKKTAKAQKIQKQENIKITAVLYRAFFKTMCYNESNKAW